MVNEVEGVYESNWCVITVSKIYEDYETPVYRIVSKHKNIVNKSLIRYGTEEQIRSMLKSYNALREKRFKL